MEEYIAKELGEKNYKSVSILICQVKGIKTWFLTVSGS